MPAAPLDVNKEAVEMLVREVGVQEAHRRTGINLNTLKTWSANGKWCAVVPAKMPASMVPIATKSTKAVDAHAELLAEDERETRSSLSRAARASAKGAEDGVPIETASDLVSLAKAYAVIHRIDAKAGQTSISIYGGQQVIACGTDAEQA